MKQLTSTKNVWLTIVLGSVIGGLAAFIQTVERISYALHPNNPLTCDINSVFSCTNVFDAWQSSVFGFSNSIMCLTFFSITLGVGIAGLTAHIGKYVRLILHFLALFFLGFGAWYLQQSAFSIGALCIFCIFCYGGVIALNWAWLRINVNDLPLPLNLINALKNGISHGADTMFWILWALAIIGMFILKFA